MSQVVASSLSEAARRLSHVSDTSGGYGDNGEQSEGEARVPLSADDLANEAEHAVLQRCSQERSEPGLLGKLLADSATSVLPISAGRVPVAGGPLRLAMRAPEPADASRDSYFLGRLAGTALVAVEVDDAPEGWLGARAIGPWLVKPELDALLTAMAVTNWHRHHPRCPRCGEPTRVATAGWTRRCDADGSEHYPRTDPAVIMSVIDADDRLLLARNGTWDEGRRSVLAGFVEPGERLEEAVAREVLEEVGVRVSEVRYVDNQPWPFPSSLMLGFSSRAADPHLRIDRTEIVEAEWYTRDELARAVAAGRVLLPTRLSIARRLIEGWFGEPLATGEEEPVVGR